MRALIRSVTGSPASAKGKAKLGKSGREQHYSISDIALNWNNIKSVSTSCTPSGIDWLDNCFAGLRCERIVSP